MEAEAPAKRTRSKTKQVVYASAAPDSEQDDENPDDDNNSDGSFEEQEELGSEEDATGGSVAGRVVSRGEGGSRRRVDGHPNADETGDSVDIPVRIFCKCTSSGVSVL